MDAVSPGHVLNSLHSQPVAALGGPVQRAHVVSMSQPRTLAN